MKHLATFLLAACAAAPAWADIDRAQLIGLSASVLKIEAEREQGGYSLGSGVVLAPDRVVTNCHVTRDAERISVVRGGARWRVASQLRDAGHDLCLLNVPGLQARVAPAVQADELKPGQSVAALGYSGGMTIQYSAGEIIALHRLDGARVIQSSNWFNSGASGGGLFDENLDLVGILTFRLRGGDAHYFAAPVRWLRAMLDAPSGSYAAVSPDRSQRLPYWQQTAANQPRFLQADRMARDSHWPELESLALEWTRADAVDPEPWYLLGVALQHMERLPQARQALECSLALEPDSSAARALLQPAAQEPGSNHPPTPANAVAQGAPTRSASAGTPCAVGAIAQPTR